MGKSQFYELPLVSYVCNSFPKNSLKNVLIIGCQHLLPTTLRMFNSLINRGLNPKNIYLLGKCYSTDPKTYKQMLKNNINAHHLSFKYQSNIPYDQLYEQNVKIFFNEILNSIDLNNFKKVIILDDGGSLINLFNNSSLSSFPNIIGIEQTSAGYSRICKLKLRFPIINVARAKIKLTHENFLVAEIVSQKLMKRLQKYKLFPKKVLIIGNGPIGSAIYQLLNGHFQQIDCFDMNSARSTISTESYKTSLHSYDMIIGCTGTTLFNGKDLKSLKKGIILVSASSSDREFNAFLIRKKTSINNGIHSDINTNNHVLLNNGFPINFDEDYLNIDHEGFQLTRSLLTGAIFQALNFQILSPRIFALSSTLQNKIISKFYNYFPGFSISKDSNKSEFIKYKKAL